VRIKRGQTLSSRDVYIARNEFTIGIKWNLKRGSFRVQGDTIDIICPIWIRLPGTLFGDKIEEIESFEMKNR